MKTMYLPLIHCGLLQSFISSYSVRRSRGPSHINFFTRLVLACNITVGKQQPTFYMLPELFYRNV